MHSVEAATRSGCKGPTSVLRFVRIFIYFFSFLITQFACSFVGTSTLFAFQCRQRVTCAAKNHLLNNLVEVFLKANPNKRRSSETLKELDEKNKIGTDTVSVWCTGVSLALLKEKLYFFLRWSRSRERLLSMQWLLILFTTRATRTVPTTWVVDNNRTLLLLLLLFLLWREFKIG